MGTLVEDLVHVRKETPYAAGLPESMGGLGGAEVITGYGLYKGVQACCREVFGLDSLEGRTVAIQGFGKVAYSFAQYLAEEGARIIASDIDESRIALASKMGATIVAPDEIYDVACDVFSPCALGGVLNSDTIPRLRAPIVAGAANNQLLEDHHAEEMQNAGILYAPDFAINPGGIITVACEMAGYGRDAALDMTSRVYQTIADVIARSKADRVTTAEAANRLAEARIESVRSVKTVYTGNGQRQG